jgi:3-hydroxyisobutyrate dehydrogenase-like beta-hydroxyacid dehydrogenase
VLSIVPPHAALPLAREVAQAGFRGTYVDANAIAPKTARDVSAVVTWAGARFIDGGIIGPPPRTAGTTRLYLSGEGAPRVAKLFAGSALEAIAIDGPIGAASSLKLCYAAWTKGSTALLAAIRALAAHEGVAQPLLDEWQRSQPDLVKKSESVVVQSPKAWRWVAEMEEIAATFEKAGLPAGFHQAAAELYGRLEAFKDRPAADLDEVLKALDQRRG